MLYIHCVKKSTRLISRKISHQDIEESIQKFSKYIYLLAVYSVVTCLYFWELEYYNIVCLLVILLAFSVYMLVGYLTAYKPRTFFHTVEIKHPNVSLITITDDNGESIKAPQVKMWERDTFYEFVLTFGSPIHILLLAYPLLFDNTQHYFILTIYISTIIIFFYLFTTLDRALKDKDLMQTELSNMTKYFSQRDTKRVTVSTHTPILVSTNQRRY